MAEVFWHREAEKEALELSPKEQEVVDKAVKEFEEEGMNYERFGRVTKPRYNFDKYKIKLKESDPVEINQRLILEIYTDNWVILGIEHREEAYEKQYIDLIKEREY